MIRLLGLLTLLFVPLAIVADADPDAALRQDEVLARQARPPSVEPVTAAIVAAAAKPSMTLVGKSEAQVRAMLGPPASVEERAPGKTWRYGDGRCGLVVQLYPNVQTRQFGTLGYTIRSEDSSDSGKRACLIGLAAAAR